MRFSSKTFKRGRGRAARRTRRANRRGRRANGVSEAMRPTRRSNRRATRRSQRGGGNTYSRAIPEAAVITNPQGLPDELEDKNVSERI